MHAVRIINHKKDRDAVLLSYVPVGEYFQIVTDEYQCDELKDIPPNIPFGLFRKISFQTNYAKFNVMDMWTGEIRTYKSDCKCVRLIIPATVEFEESRFDRPILKGI